MNDYLKKEDRIKKYSLQLSETEFRLVSQALSCYLVGELPLLVSPYYKELVRGLKNRMDLADMNNQFKTNEESNV